MTSEQLQHARAEKWRQTSNPVLTNDDAASWVESIGLCLFSPRRAHFAAPAPSFVEAAAGSPTEAPGRDAMENAVLLLRRLTEASQVAPLNLFGEVGGGSSDQPDFVVSREGLPYVFSMIGGRNWKTGPGAKASPLMTEIWSLLHDKGALTAQEIQTELGRELTEAAVLRAVVELWRGLRVIPVYGDEATRWELTQVRFADELTASQKVAQTTALSALAALYLDSVIAASAEGVEAFLSPLASRSRIREVVNGLMATRQIALTSVGAQPLLHVAGSLPEFAEEPSMPKPPVERAARREEREERTSARGRETGADRRPGPKPFERDRGSRVRPEGGSFGGERKPFRRESDYKKSSFDRGARKPPSDRAFGQDRPAPRERREGERPPFRGQRNERGEGRENRFGAGKGYDKGGRFQSRGRSEDRREPRGDNRKEGFDRERPREGKRPFFRDRGERPQYGRRREFGGDKPAFGGERRERTQGVRGEGQKGFQREGQPFRKRHGEGQRGERSFQKQGRPEFRRAGKAGFDRGSKPRFERRDKPEFPRGDKPDFARKRKPEFGQGPAGREDRERKSFGDRPAKPFKSGKPFASRKPFGKDSRPFEKSGDRKSGKPFGKSDRPFGKSDRPYAKGKPGFRKSDKPGSGPRKPGGFKPPFRKRKPEGDKGSE